MDGCPLGLGLIVETEISLLNFHDINYDMMGGGVRERHLGGDG